ncbi:MAG: thiamine-phosphate synthase [Candidatus Acidoferrum typicum]|nr:thiamine-phosphate synthase [Candidatus Acidoferrum typicum]
MSPLLCYVTDRHSLRVANQAESVAALIPKTEEIAAAAVDWVQIREKDLPARELASFTRQALAIAEKVSAKRASALRVLINDRLDVAMAERAGGVHLGEKSLPVAVAKRLVESAVRKQIVDESFLIGVSCHSLETAQAAQRDGADYVFFGPIFATPSKAAFGAPQGLARLAQVCRALKIPVLAIGGITLENAEPCIIEGAAGVAAIRLFQDAPDPVGLVQTLHRVVRGFTSA